MDGTKLSAAERTLLLAVAVVGLLGLNGVFVWALLARPDLVAATLANPLALAFVAEALLMTAVLAWLLTRWGRNPLGPVWFVVWALVGGLAFAVPLVTLLRERRERA